MNGSFGMMVTAALSLILSLHSAPARGSAMTVAGGVRQTTNARTYAAGDQDIYLSQTSAEESAFGFQFGADADLNRVDAMHFDTVGVKYSGSQLNDALLTWNGHDVGPDALATPSADEKAKTRRFVASQPFNALVNEVPLPISAWQIIVGILAVVAIKLPRPTRMPIRVQFPAKKFRNSGR
jgi:hypothetical protein